MKRILLLAVCVMTWIFPVRIAAAGNNLGEQEIINYAQIRQRSLEDERRFAQLRQEDNSRPKAGSGKIATKGKSLVARHGKESIPQTAGSYNRRDYSKEEIQDLMKSKVIAKWGEDQWAGMAYIMSHESGSNPYAKNKSSGACGIPQALPCSKLLKVIGSLDNVDGQLDWMISYIESRYDTPNKAMAFHKSHNWY